MQFTKKASLEISIQAIIIIVLAMTFLGLGLTFIKKQIGTISDTASSVQEQVKQQILEELRSGDKKLSFAANEVIIAIQNSKVLAVGIKNTKQVALSFTLNIQLIDEASGTRKEPNNALKTSSIFTDPDGIYIYNAGLEKLAVNEARVYPIKYTAPENVKTKTFEIIVCECPTSAATPNDCIQKTTASLITPCKGSEYDTKTFFVTIN